MQYFYVIKNIGHHARLRGKGHRTSSTIRLPVTGNSHFEKERTVFWHFQRFLHFRFFSFFATNFHLIFPSMPFQNAHYSRMRAFRQGNLPLYFVANYVLLCAVQDAQCNTEESPLKKKTKTKKQRLQLRGKCSNT